MAGKFSHGAGWALLSAVVFSERRSPRATGTERDCSRCRPALTHPPLSSLPSDPSDNERRTTWLLLKNPQS